MLQYPQVSIMDSVLYWLVDLVGLVVFMEDLSVFFYVFVVGC